MNVKTRLDKCKTRAKLKVFKYLQAKALLYMVSLMISQNITHLNKCSAGYGPTNEQPVQEHYSLKKPRATDNREFIKDLSRNQLIFDASSFKATSVH